MSKQCLIPGCEEPAVTTFCEAHWCRIPIELRRRWWGETEYGKHPPSPELAKEIADYFNSQAEVGAL